MEDFSIDTYFKLLQKNGSIHALEYRATYTPDYIYKFCSLIKDEGENQKRFSSLESNCIWFGRCDVMNDPFEFKGLYLDREQFTSLGFDGSYCDIVEATLQNNIFLACFTSNMNTNMPMWGNYANNHKGYCVKYKVNNKRKVRNVIYEPRRIPICNLIRELFSYYAMLDSQDHRIKLANDNESKRRLDLIQTLLQDIYFIKHDSWKYENEFRIIYPVEELDEKETGTNIPVSDVDLSIEAIYAGCNCVDVHKMRLKQIAEKLNVNYFECKPGSTDFIIENV